MDVMYVYRLEGRGNQNRAARGPGVNISPTQTVFKVAFALIQSILSYRKNKRKTKEKVQKPFKPFHTLTWPDLLPSKWNINC